jgi:uncharacterized membrane protein
MISNPAELLKPKILSTVSRVRIQSVDVLRGVVMIIMALDHTRDFFHIAADPTNMATTTPALFFTRWITHFCAPVFVFLSGTSAYLSGRRKTKKELSSFLIKRGIWLVIIELTVFNFLLTFDPGYHFLAVQVLWVIGVSMIILGLLCRLSVPVLLTIGCLLIFGHNLLDAFDATTPGATRLWWGLLHQQSFFPYDDKRIFAVLYPLLPWPGVMMAGYCLGTLYTTTFPAAKRRKILFMIGSVVTVLFVVLRLINVYGDPIPWAVQKSGIMTALSFLNVTKYPPSLLFLCMTLGPALLFLGLLEKINRNAEFKSNAVKIVSIYGRVPLFYFLFHFFVLHLLLMILFFVNGHSMEQATSGFIYFKPEVGGYSLKVVYLIWLAVVVALYPVCKWYDRLKSSHKKWWLSYL